MLEISMIDETACMSVWFSPTGGDSDNIQRRRRTRTSSGSTDSSNTFGTSPPRSLQFGLSVSTIFCLYERVADGYPDQGICFGHQIVARALGGECVPNGGNWEVGVTKIDLTETGKKLFGVSELVSTNHMSRASLTLTGLIRGQNIEEMHRDHVPEVPPSFHLLGSSPIAPNQGMVQLYPGASPSSLTPSDVHIFTVQGHPEFHKQITSEIVKARRSTGVLSADIAEDFERRADWRNDGVDVVGKTLWKILEASKAR